MGKVLFRFSASGARLWISGILIASEWAGPVMERSWCPHTTTANQVGLETNGDYALLTSYCWTSSDGSMMQCRLRNQWLKCKCKSSVWLRKFIYRSWSLESTALRQTTLCKAQFLHPVLYIRQQNPEVDSARAEVRYNICAYVSLWNRKIDPQTQQLCQGDHTQQQWHMQQDLN